MQRVLIISSILLVLGISSYAADFHVDPLNGKSTGDGSAAKPWSSLQKVIDSGLVESRNWESLPYEESRPLVARNAGAKVKAGDTIWLHTGDYGGLSVQGFYNTGAITIAAYQKQEPRFHSVRLRSSSNWTLKGLHVSPEYGAGKKPRTLIDLESHGWAGPIQDITVEGCWLRSVEDSSKWSAEDWNQLTCNGIGADGTRITLRGNRLKNVNFGIDVNASHSMVENNMVENFSGDGLRGLGDYSTFQYNTVKNCYDVNDNHDDGFQSWSVGEGGVGTGVVKGMVLRGNTIINFEDPNQPHRGSLQGIGCFDGMFEDWVVENNVVIVDHWHGITLGGARNCRIVNNTVLDLNKTKPGPPWITIGNHKKGMPSSGCTIRNNLALVTTKANAQANMVVDHNIEVFDKESFFMNAAAFDFHLKKGCPAIDAGSSTLAPSIDINKTPRPQGAAVDPGACEFGMK